MKRTVLLAVVIISCSICARAQEQQAGIKVSYPSFKESVKDYGRKSRKKKLVPNDRLTLTEVELNDTTTVLTFECACLPSSKTEEGCSYSIGKDCFLVTVLDGAYSYYDFLRAEGIAIAPGKIEVPRGGTVRFKLIFKSLPEGTDKFNLCEPGGWNLADIDLSSSNSPESQRVGTFDVEEYVVRPTFLGGDVKSGVAVWVQQRLVYPDICRKAGLEETVLLKLTVDKDGIVHSALHKGYTQLFIDEALRVTRMMPPMTPCTIYGRRCVIKYIFPVVFKTNNGIYSPLIDKNSL